MKKPKTKKRQRTMAKKKYCFTCCNTGWFLCNRGIVSCHVCQLGKK